MTGGTESTQRLPTSANPVLQLITQPGYPVIEPLVGADCAQTKEKAWLEVALFPTRSVVYMLTVVGVLMANAPAYRGDAAVAAPTRLYLMVPASFRLMDTFWVPLYVPAAGESEAWGAAVSSTTPT